MCVSAWSQRLLCVSWCYAEVCNQPSVSVTVNIRNGWAVQALHRMRKRFHSTCCVTEEANILLFPSLYLCIRGSKHICACVYWPSFSCGGCPRCCWPASWVQAAWRYSAASPPSPGCAHPSGPCARSRHPSPGSEGDRAGGSWTRCRISAFVTRESPNPKERDTEKTKGEI